MKLWLCRTPVIDSCDIREYCEVYPERAFVYTKLYFCYEEPKDPYCNDVRKVEIPNYLYPEIKPNRCKLFTDTIVFDPTLFNNISK